MKAERIICPAGTGAFALYAVFKVLTAFQQPSHGPELMADAMLLSFGGLGWSFVFLRLGRKNVANGSRTRGLPDMECPESGQPDGHWAGATR